MGSNLKPHKPKACSSIGFPLQLDLVEPIYINNSNNNNNNVYLVFAIVRLNQMYEKIKKLHNKNIINVKIHWIY